MSQINQTRKPAPPVFTHEGGKGQRTDAYHALRRTLMCCLLWEDSFYENGVSVADRMKSLIPKISADELFNLAIEARTDFGLRHAPLLVAREMARGTPEQRAIIPHLLPAIMQRPDEIAEFMALYWADNGGKKFVSHPVRRGIALALGKFKQFQLAKWDKKDKEVRIRDAVFMSHVKPDDVPHGKRWAAAERKADRKAGEVRAWPFTERETVQFELSNDLLKQTGTWEDRLSAGEPAKVVFTELMEKGELGALAFIRNVRKMESAAVDSGLIKQYSTTVPLRGVFPHQLITAARVNKPYEDMFDQMLLRLTAGMPKLAGKTLVLVDVSGSMNDPLSTHDAKPQYRSKKAGPVVEPTKRLDAACAVAIMARDLGEEVRVYSFSYNAIQVPNRRGMALRDAIDKSQPHGGTALAASIKTVNKEWAYDRIIVVTDEQSQDGSAPPLKGSFAYMLNVGTYKNGVESSGGWQKIDGWSPAVIRYIQQLESEKAR